MTLTEAIELRPQNPREPFAMSLLRKLAETGGEVTHLETPAGRLRMISRGSRRLPPLLVLHGLGDSIAGWGQASLPLLARFRVHIVDLAGHGLSDAPPNWKLSTMLAGARAAVQAVPGARIVGHSMGGWLALKLILEGSIAPPGLVLVNPGGPLLPESSWDPFRKLILAEDHHGARRYLRSAFHSSPKALELFPGEVLKQMRAPPISGVINSLVEADFIATGDLANLSVPTRLIWGASDRLLPAETLPFWRKELARAEFHLLEKAGHCPHLERPLALAKMIAAPF